MSMVHVNWHPDARELRKFGLTVLIGLGLVGALLWCGFWPFGEPNARAATVVWVVGAVIGGLGLTGMPVALPGYWLWMSIAFVMGNIMSRVVLTLFYVGIILPIGLVMRLIGRDKLQLRRPRGSSCWCDVEQPADRARYRRQF